NHIEQVKEQLTRKPRQAPELWLNPDKQNLDDFSMADIKVKNYDPYPVIKAPVAV
ncbi:thymidylate synthase, partial [Lactobacillus parabuchneri]|nr:thymidylate synthase [Lentilactobacillus parabuchneri]